MAEKGKTGTNGASRAVDAPDATTASEQVSSGSSATEKPAEPESAPVVAPVASQGDIAAAERAAVQVDAIAPPEQDVERARKVIAHLFEIMGIKRVISVDDDYEGTLEEFLGMAAAVAATTETAKPFAGEFDLTEPEEVWQSHINDRWWELTETQQHLLIARGKKQTGHSDPEAQPDASAIQQLLPDSEVVEFLAWTPEQWAEKQDEIIREAQTVPTLLMLDRNMGDQTDEGLRLAEELFSKDDQSCMYVALLTRTVTKGGEPAAWKKLTSSFPGLASERFVIVSKGHLGPEPETFPQSIKIVLMARPASLLRKVVKEAISNGMDQASKEMEKLTPEDFERMIFGASMKEGIWEPESLLRVFQVFMRKVVRGALYGSEELRKSATEVRRLCAVDTPEPPETSTAIAIQRAELYDFPEHLNSVHLPIELGDVFETPSGVQFVLIEQPCDLMVRSDGVRGSEIHEALLLPIRRDKPSPDRVHLAFELPFYYDDGASAWVYVNRPLLAPMYALDMTVFNTDGKSVFDVRKAAPEGLWPAWEKRYDVVAARVRELQSTFSQVEKLRSDGQISEALRKKLVESLLHSDKESGRRIRGRILSDGVMEYKIQRVRRILPLRAPALLSRHSLHKARDAFDFDLAATTGGEESTDSASA